MFMLLLFFLLLWHVPSKRSYCYPIIVVASHVSVAMLRCNYKLSTQHPRTPLSLTLAPSLILTHANTHTIIKGQISMALIICTLYISKSSIAPPAPFPKRGSSMQDMCMGRMIDMLRRMRNLRAAHLISCTASVAGSVRECGSKCVAGSV